MKFSLRIDQNLSEDFSTIKVLKDIYLDYGLGWSSEHEPLPERALLEPCLLQLVGVLANAKGNLVFNYYTDSAGSNHAPQDSEFTLNDLLLLIKEGAIKLNPDENEDDEPKSPLTDKWRHKIEDAILETLKYINMLPDVVDLSPMDTEEASNIDLSTNDRNHVASINDEIDVFLRVEDGLAYLDFVPEVYPCMVQNDPWSEGSIQSFSSEYNWPDRVLDVANDITFEAQSATKFVVSLGEV